MPKCMHQGHKALTASFTSEKKGKILLSMITGWNPVYRRFEYCDEGLMPIRQPRGRKVLRNAEAD